MWSKDQGKYAKEQADRAKEAATEADYWANQTENTLQDLSPLTDRAESAVTYIEGKQPQIDKALLDSGQALLNSQQTQTELDQAILAGDSSPLGGQLSVGAGGKVYSSAQERLLKENELVTQQLADMENQTYKIYGVFWDKSSNPVMTRTNDAQGMVAAVGTGSQYIHNDFDDAQIYREIAKVTDSTGNVFVRIPKFYVKKTDGTGFKSIQITKAKLPGYYLPRSFWDFKNNKELPYIDVGAHLASLSADNKLESKPNKYPLVSRNIVQFRDYAKANNTVDITGYQQLDVHAIDVLTTLFYVEFATLDSQSVMSGFTNGQYSESHVALQTELQANRIVLPKAQADLFRIGQSIGIGTSRGGNQIASYRTITAIQEIDTTNSAIIFDGVPLDITAGNFVYNTGYKTGTSMDVASSSGSVGSVSDGKYPCVYRGIESLWGDIWQFVDGVNINDNQTWVCDDADKYASNVFTSPYEKLSYINTNVNGYVKRTGYDALNPSVEFPIETGAGHTTYYADYYYQSAGARIALLGGYWTYGVSAGLSYWNLHNSSSAAYLVIGGRLLKKPS